MPLSWVNLHLAAFRDATRAHQELGIDTTRPIDPFEALKSVGVVTLRRPLHGAAGIYLPSSPPDREAPGVLVNVLHPLSKQRYTAAHELSHHRRDRLTIIDLETEVLARRDDDRSAREVFAEAFAAWFLMPRALVATALDAIGTAAEDLTTATAYRLALELQTSYQATVHHLGDLRIISSSLRRQLLQASPSAVKEALGARLAASDLRRDVWQIEVGRDAGRVMATEGDVLVLDVAESPSTGFLWSIHAPHGITIVADAWTARDENSLGGAGVHRFWLTLDEPGHAVVRLEKKRPWRTEVATHADIRIEAVERPSAGIVEPAQLALTPA